MERRSFYDITKIIVAIIAACLLTYHSSNGTLLNINKFQMREYSSLQRFEIINAKLLNTNIIRSTNEDSQIIIKDVNGYVQNVSITIDQISQKDFAIQVFYDTGRGFNAEEVSSVWGKIGDNLLQLNSKTKVNSIRIDPTNLADHELSIGKIIINQQPSPRSLSLILIFNVAFLLFITLFYLREGSMKYKIITFIFYTAVLYIADNFWLSSIPAVLNILFFVVLYLTLIIVPLIWKEVKKSAEESHQE